MTLPATSVYRAFVDTSERFADRPFLKILPAVARVYDIEADTFSYADVAEAVNCLRERYASAGYGVGHRAGLLLENRPSFITHWLALNSLGVSVVPINRDWQCAELEYLIDNSEICLAVALPECHELLETAAQAAGRPLTIVAPNDLSALAEPPAPARDEAISSNTECALLYTSGTTGRPKGCILPNEYFLWAGQWYRDIGGLVDIREGRETLISPLPLVHMNAMAYSTMVMLLSGGCVVLMDRFHPRSWWQSVRDSEATIVHYLGVMPAMLLGAEESDTDREHKVRFGFGAGVDPGQHATFETRFGFPLLEAWAMTETGAGAVIIANREPRLVGQGCFGRAEDKVQYRIVDDAGQDVPVGEKGELWVRAAGEDPTFGFFKGYFKNPEATREAWADGYFHTGDIVRVNEEGHFFFIDRKKNVIRRSGENISAVEVEGVLLKHRYVLNVGVAAVPDAVRGDEVLSCVVLDDAAKGLSAADIAADIAAFCREQLAYYKVPAYFHFCKALPLTATNKVQRAALKQMAHQALEQRDCVDLGHLKKRKLS